VFSVAGDAGFSHIEVMVDNRPDSQDLATLRSLQASFQTDICSIHAPFLLISRKVWGQPLNKLLQSMSFARELGSRVVIIHLPYFWQIEYARWLYRSVNQLNRETHLTVAVENAIYVNLRKRVNLSFFNNLEDLGTFDSLVFDTSHFAISHTDLFAAWDRLGPRVKHIHLSNNYLKGFDDHELPQAGNLPLDRFLNRIAADGYDGIITLELNPGSLGAKSGRDEVVKRLASSLEFCTTHFSGGLNASRTA
jgi:sugar phosphate isomerase/epimerase